MQHGPKATPLCQGCPPWRLLRSPCSKPSIWINVTLSSIISYPSSYLCLHTSVTALDHVRASVLSHFSHVQFFAALWTVAHQASLSMGFSRQEYWSGLPCPPPRNLPNPGIEPTSLMSPALAGRFFTTSATWEAISTTQTKARSLWNSSVIFQHLNKASGYEILNLS